MPQNFTPIDDIVEKNQISYSSSFKEAEPVFAKNEDNNMQEVVEHEPEDEVKPFLGIRAETIELPPDLKKLGVQSSSSSSKFQSYTNIKLPISDDKVISGLHAPITSSLRWLATLAFYLLKKAHLSLKKVHGKVVRVVVG